MKIRNLMHVFMEGAGDEGGQGGGSTPPQNTPAPSDLFSGLAPEYAEKLTASGVKDIQGLAKQFIDLQAHLGTSIRVPSEHASPEDRAKFIEKLTKHAPNLVVRPDKADAAAMADFYRTIGRPEDPSKYPLEVPEDAKHLVDESKIQALQKIAFDNGLSADQFKALIEFNLNDLKASNQMMTEAAKADNDKLRAKWGSAYDKNIGIVAEMAKATGAPEALVNMAKEGKLGADVADWMYQLSNQIRTPEGKSYRDSGGSSVMTPAEAHSQVSEIMNNRNHPYWVASHPEHASAVKRMVELMTYANPDSSTSINSLRASR